jgi:hypothetical protein
MLDASSSTPCLLARRHTSHRLRLAPRAECSRRRIAALAGATALSVRALLRSAAAGEDTWSRRQRAGCDDGTYDAVLAYPE